jgi:thymidylate synthase
MNKLDKDYQNLLKDILANGVEKEDRTGTGTISVFGRQIRHNMQDGFPLLTTKKMAIKSVMIELKWFLSGDTNIKYLLDNGCNIWTGDAYKRYKQVWEYDLDEPLSIEDFAERIKTEPDFAQVWGDLGPIYGNQWREWGSKYETNHILHETKRRKPGIDQIKNLIEQIKQNPDSRRLMVSAWNVDELEFMVLPPCHYGFQVYTTIIDTVERRKLWANSVGHNEHYAANLDDEDLDARGFPSRRISLMWNQRSVDTFLGLPFNIASYGMLLELLAREVNMIPGELIGNLGDVHIYTNHIKQVNTLCSRMPMKLPKLTMLQDIDFNTGQFDYEISEYESHPAIKAPLSN